MSQIPDCKNDGLWFFEKNKMTFTGINAGEYITKEDFEVFLDSMSPEEVKVLRKDIEKLQRTVDGLLETGTSKLSLKQLTQKDEEVKRLREENESSKITNGLLIQRLEKLEIENGHQQCQLIIKEAIVETLRKEKGSDYWKQRCEAAEDVIDKFAAIPLHPDVTERGKTIFNDWIKLKTNPETTEQSTLQDSKIISFFTWLQNEGYEMSDTKPHHCYLGGKNYIITDLLDKFKTTIQ